MSEQLTNAQIIVSVGIQVGANAKQLLAAIEAGLVESGLRNLNYGDRDSLGIFQQRPSQGWGSPSQVRDPDYAARAFFLGAGTNSGALAVNQSGTAGQLAQRVQRSAFPGRYDERQAEAENFLAQLQPVQASTLEDWSPTNADWGAQPSTDVSLFQDTTTSGIGIGGVAVAAVAIVALLLIIDW